MTIREARELARMTQQEVEDEYGIPRRSLQNWETGARNCPDYVEEWLIEKLVQSVRYAQIRWEDDFKGQKGFSCWLNDPDNEEMKFSWFYPVYEEGTISSQVVWKIGQMIEAGWKVMFIE